jgi:ribonuclease HI
LFPGLNVYQQSWRRKGWKTSTGQPVKNADLIKYIIHKLGRRPGKLKMTHVRGHMGVYGNEMADRLANAGALLPEAPERDYNSRAAGMGSEEDLGQREMLAGVIYSIEEGDLATPEEMEEEISIP